MALDPVVSTTLISAAVSTITLFLFNAFPIDGGKRKNKHEWVKAAVYFFTLSVAVMLPLQFLSKKWLCPSKQ